MKVQAFAPQPLNPQELQGFTHLWQRAQQYGQLGLVAEEVDMGHGAFRNSPCEVNVVAHVGDQRRLDDVEAREVHDQDQQSEAQSGQG